jgi:hypothetical protein
VAKAKITLKKLLEYFKRHVHPTLLRNPHPSKLQLDAWCDEVVKLCGPGSDDELVDLITLIGMYSQQQVNNYYEEYIDMSGEGDKILVNTGGGSVTGSAIGKNQVIRFGDVKAYNEFLNQAGATISGGVKASLLKARGDIEASSLPAAIKDRVLTDFDQLSQEAAKPSGEQDKSILGYCWNAVKGVASTIPSLLDVGRQLGLPI